MADLDTGVAWYGPLVGDKTANRPAHPVDLAVYANAPHAFFADYRPSYREVAATDGWRRLVDWLKKNGVA